MGGGGGEGYLNPQSMDNTYVADKKALWGFRQLRLHSAVQPNSQRFPFPAGVPSPFRGDLGASPFWLLILIQHPTSRGFRV